MKSNVRHDLAVDTNYAAALVVSISEDKRVLIRNLVAGHVAGPEDIGNELVQLVGFARRGGSRSVDAVYSISSFQSPAVRACPSSEERTHDGRRARPRKLAGQISGVTAGSNRPVSTDFMAASKTAMFLTP